MKPEIKVLLDRIQQLVEKSPQKAARILHEWIRKPARKTPLLKKTG